MLWIICTLWFCVTVIVQLALITLAIPAILVWKKHVRNKIKSYSSMSLHVQYKWQLWRWFPISILHLNSGIIYVSPLEDPQSKLFLCAKLHWTFDDMIQMIAALVTRRSRSVYLCQLVDKMWKLLILLSSDCIRKTWLLSSNFEQPEFWGYEAAAVQYVKYILYQIAEYICCPVY